MGQGELAHNTHTLTASFSLQASKRDQNFAAFADGKIRCTHCDGIVSRSMCRWPLDLPDLAIGLLLQTWCLEPLSRPGAAALLELEWCSGQPQVTGTPIKKTRPEQVSALDATAT